MTPPDQSRIANAVNASRVFYLDPTRRVEVRREDWDTAMRKHGFTNEDALDGIWEAGRVASQRANLPDRIALCPEHAGEFYYPLSDGEGLTCPACPLKMTVYVREDGRP